MDAAKLSEATHRGREIAHGAMDFIRRSRVVKVLSGFALTTALILHPASAVMADSRPSPAPAEASPNPSPNADNLSGHIDADLICDTDSLRATNTTDEKVRIQDEPFALNPDGTKGKDMPEPEIVEVGPHTTETVQPLRGVHLAGTYNELHFTLADGTKFRASRLGIVCPPEVNVPEAPTSTVTLPAIPTATVTPPPENQPNQVLTTVIPPSELHEELGTRIDVPHGIAG